jgi:hypothetical protein
MVLMLFRVAAIAAVVLVGVVGLPTTAPFDHEGHESSLRAKITMTDGTCHAVTLQGVGCRESMCSRVRVRGTKTESVWLDGLASVREISQNPEGPVHAVLTFKDGSSREISINALNRVLYVGSLFWTRQLDLTGVSQIDFE